ncbi:hypothetical protein DsansV1_C29g0206731 [Dioscorea sansibarensis]
MNLKKNYLNPKKPYSCCYFSSALLASPTAPRHAFPFSSFHHGGRSAHQARRPATSCYRRRGGSNQHVHHAGISILRISLVLGGGFHPSLGGVLLQ